MTSANEEELARLEAEALLRRQKAWDAAHPEEAARRRAKEREQYNRIMQERRLE